MCSSSCLGLGAIFLSNWLFSWLMFLCKHFIHSVNRYSGPSPIHRQYLFSSAFSFMQVTVLFIKLSFAPRCSCYIVLWTLKSHNVFISWGFWKLEGGWIFYFYFFDTWWEERRIKCACFLKKQQLLWRMGLRGETMGESESFNYKFVFCFFLSICYTVLSSHQRLLSFEFCNQIGTNNIVDYTVHNLEGLILNYLLVNKNSSCQATSPNRGLSLPWDFSKENSVRNLPYVYLLQVSYLSVSCN